MTDIRRVSSSVNKSSSDIDRRVSLFRRAFAGAEGVYAIRTASGWHPVYTALRDKDVIDHLCGRVEIGAYPVLEQRDPAGWPTCRWIGADFDGKRPGTSWETDIVRAMEFFAGAPVVLNFSRSGHGAHIRVLFAEPVPTWLARRWMLALLTEAGVTRADGDEEVPSSYDRCIPSQDDLSSGKIGSLLGCPLNAERVKATGNASLLLHAEDAATHGRLTAVPVESHWDYLESVTARAWSRADLEAAMLETSSTLGLTAPPKRAESTHLNVIADVHLLHFTASFCGFLRWCAENPSLVNYELWVALAANLHTFGEAGRDLFHSLSALDSTRYNASQTDWKWQSTAGLGPVRCDTIAGRGFRCPHLGTPRCGGASSPAHFHHWTRYEPI
jgi:hypothetical protein